MQIYKANDIAISYPETLVIGADTIVVIDDKIFGKPQNKTHGIHMLQSLSDWTHIVYTGISVQHSSQKIKHTSYARTYVTFMDITDEYSSYYIDTYNPLDKAGSYGIQDWFSVCVKEINGCFCNVMGFPLATFYKYYRQR